MGIATGIETETGTETETETVVGEIAAGGALHRGGHDHEVQAAGVEAGLGENEGMSSGGRHTRSEKHFRPQGFEICRR